MREILDAILDPAFDGFARNRTMKIAAAVGMAQYSEGLDKLMANDLSAAELSQHPRRGRRRRAPHTVAHGGNRKVSACHVIPQRGGAKSPLNGEDRIMVPSPKDATYDLQPEMSAPELTDKAVEAITSGK